jgi:MFS family permease
MGGTGVTHNIVLFRDFSKIQGKSLKPMRTQTQNQEGSSAYFIAIMAIMTAFLYADQNLLAPNLSVVAREFGFTTQERDVKLGGYISLAFFLVGGMVALLIGRFADRFDRTKLLALVVVAGEIPCAATYFCDSYEQLFVCRILTGISIGGAPPLVYSLLGDLVEAKRRPAFAGLLLTAMGFGILLGQVLAGLSSPYTGWRFPFLVVALPNVLIVLLFLCTVREPRRLGRASSSSSKRALRAYAALLKTRSNRILVAQGMVGTLPWAMIFVFLNDYLAQDQFMGVKKASLVIGALGGAALFGALIGGLSGNMISRKNPNWLPWACFVPTLIAAAPLWVLINNEYSADQSILSVMLMAAATGFPAAFAGPNLRAILLNVNLGDCRGSMTALITLADDLGKALGPALIAGLVVLFGRRFAFELTCTAWILCALIMTNLSWSYPTDQQEQVHSSFPRRIQSAVRQSVVPVSVAWKGRRKSRVVRSEL